MDDPKKITQDILSFMKEAGALALAKQEKVTAEFKPDQSIVTEADLAVTKLFYDRFSLYFDRDDTAVIDEEAEDKNRDTAERARYVWSLDPIDGTTTYFNGLPLWGISLGLFKDGKPWIGAVYLPALKELIYCDGDQAFFVSEAYTGKEIRRTVSSVDSSLSKKSAVFIAPWLGDVYDYESVTESLLDIYSYVMQLAYVCLGRGKGCFFLAYVWDMAGIWPVVDKLGLGFYDIISGNRLSGFDLTRFDNDLRVKNMHILCHPNNFDILKTLIK